MNLNEIMNIMKLNAINFPKIKQNNHSTILLEIKI